MTEFSRQFEKALVRFRAAVTEEDSSRSDEIDNSFGQSSLRFRFRKCKKINRLMKHYLPELRTV